MVTGYRAADFGWQPEDITNRSHNPLFQLVRLNWVGPIEWENGDKRPFDHNEPCLYILQREHANAQQQMRIVYVGLTINPQGRFINHPTASDILGRRGKTFLSYAAVDFVTGRNREARTKGTLEQIEHLMIWALWPHLENDRKMFTLPGMGANGGTAWQIQNGGYRFQGQMPREIVYPWMLVKRGRNRSART